MLDEFLEKRANMTRQELSRLSRKEAAKVTGGKGNLHAQDAYDSLPLYLYRQFLDPYMKGPAFVAAVRKKGGWKAVDELFTKPPASMKEILHPDKPRVPLDKRRDPRPRHHHRQRLQADVREHVRRDRRPMRARGEGPLEEGSRRAGTDRLDLERRPLPVLRELGTSTCTVWVTSWETDDAAKEFEVAGKEILKAEWSTTTDSFCERREKRVLIVTNAPRKKQKPLVEALFGAK